MPRPKERDQCRGEELANGISHGVGALAALPAAPLLIGGAVGSGGAAVVGVSVFAAALLSMYLTSTLYHLLPKNRAKPVFRILDHSMIFIFIAGTYTPFTLGILHGPWGWTLFGLIWGLAGAGILLKTTCGVRHRRLSLAMYLGMGWLILIALEPLLHLIPAQGLWWLVAGGLAYTFGSVFYAMDDRFRYSHFVWHLFVLLGTFCHCVTIAAYAHAPRPGV